MAVVAFIVLIVIPVLLLIAASEGMLGQRAQQWVNELNETGQRDRVQRHLDEADKASSAAHLDARSAMNKAAGQGWRNMSEWRDD